MTMNLGVPGPLSGDHGGSSVAIDLARCLARYCVDGEWQGVAYAGRETFWFRGNATVGWERVLDETVAAPQWSEVFEVRVFDGLREVRWWDSQGGAHAVVAVPLAGRERSWLLWGSVVAFGVPGWARTHEARIGPIAVPRPPGAWAVGETRIGLVVTERRAVDEHGNTSVADEVLTRLVWRDEEAPGDD